MTLISLEKENQSKKAKANTSNLLAQEILAKDAAINLNINDKLLTEYVDIDDIQEKAQNMDSSLDFNIQRTNRSQSIENQTIDTIDTATQNHTVLKPKCQAEVPEENGIWFTPKTTKRLCDQRTNTLKLPSPVFSEKVSDNEKSPIYQRLEPKAKVSCTNCRTVMAELEETKRKLKEKENQLRQIQTMLVPDIVSAVEKLNHFVGGDKVVDESLGKSFSNDEPLLSTSQQSMGCISPQSHNSLKTKSYFLTPKLKATTSTPKTTPSSINNSNKTASSTSQVNKPIQTPLSVVNKPTQTSSSVVSKPIRTSSSVVSKPIQTSSSVVSKPIKKSPSTLCKPIQIATNHNQNSKPIESQTATNQSSLTSNNSSNDTSTGLKQLGDCTPHIFLTDMEMTRIRAKTNNMASWRKFVNLILGLKFTKDELKKSSALGLADKKTGRVRPALNPFIINELSTYTTRRWPFGSAGGCRETDVTKVINVKCNTARKPPSSKKSNADDEAEE
ncbi:myb-like protein V [Clytia hemisphaerica]|uniref:myb-like protein V n=1 Tax=Clytia hemisphaerica TaxID=252671 RepID=UPI0034D77DC2